MLFSVFWVAVQPHCCRLSSWVSSRISIRYQSMCVQTSDGRCTYGLVAAGNSAQHTIWSQCLPDLASSLARAIFSEESKGTKSTVAPFPKRSTARAFERSADATLPLLDVVEGLVFEELVAAKYARRSLHIRSEQLSCPFFILVPVFKLLVLDGVGFEGTGSRHGGGGIGVRGEREGRLVWRRLGCAGRGSSRVARGCDCRGQVR
jgi:hypothetical protein